MSVLRGILFNRVPQLTITQGPLKLLSGQLHLPDGTAAAPSLAFSSETTLGWYRYAAGFLGLSAGKNLWLPNGSTIFARNFANNSNKSLLYLNGSDKLILGEGGVDLLMGGDNNQDIGASGVNRPRTGYFGTSVVAPAVLFSSSYGIRVTGTTLTLDAGSLDINSVAIGPLPATVGTVRLLKNATIQARNAANTADIIALGVNTSDQVALGPSQNVIAGAGFVAIGTNPSTAGELRLPNAGLIAARNAANTADITALTVDTSNRVALGPSQNVIAGAGYLSIGTNPAGGGEIRLPNTGRIAARNALNSADVSIISVDASNVVAFGQVRSAAAVPANFAATFYIRFHDNAGNEFYIPGANAAW